LVKNWKIFKNYLFRTFISAGGVIRVVTITMIRIAEAISGVIIP
jgi:hypothetical protein